MGSEDGLSPGTRDSDESVSTTSGSATTTTKNACETGASWGARNDFAFERSSTGGDFADAVNALVQKSEAAPIAVSSHMDPGCVWMVAFSAPDGAGATTTRHATTFTPMLRHPAGLWTAAPQSSGWLRIVDRAAHAVWIPIVDATGSATYADASCASLSQVRVNAVVPASAAELALETNTGLRTVRDLMGVEPDARGWNVRFAFSADTTR